MTITLFAGLPGFAFATLATYGAITLLSQAQMWLADRFTADIRHLRVTRRWDRPGSWVTLPDGTEAVIEETWRDRETCGGVAKVCPYVDEKEQEPQWAPISILRPADA